MFVKQYVSNQCRLEDLFHWLGCVVRDYEIKIVVRNHEHSSTVSIWNRLNFLNLTTIDSCYVQFAWPTELLQSVPSMHNNQRNNLYHHIYSLFNYFAIVEFWVVHGYYKIAVLARKWFIFFHCMYSLLQMSFDQAVYWKRKNWFLPSI